MGRSVLWVARILGVGLLSGVHLLLFVSLISADIGGLLARGPQGEELGAVYKDSAEGRRTKAFVEILSWPVLRPYELLRDRIAPGAQQRSIIWRIAGDLSLYTNSLIWGAALWTLLELLLRVPFRLLRRS